MCVMEQEQLLGPFQRCFLAAVLCAMMLILWGTSSSADSLLVSDYAYAPEDATRGASAEMTLHAADGCRHVYVDIGTNSGVQIHKLFNQTLFPKAAIGPIFDRYFGRGPRNDVCAFGFEPNPSHKAVLQSIEAYYRSGGRTISISLTAGGVFSGWGVMDMKWAGGIENKEWGASVKPVTVEAGESPPAGAVPVTDIPSWLTHNVRRRRILDQSGGLLPPSVVMKIDIEGTDELVLAGIFSQGSLCSVDYAYVEHVRPAVLDFLAASLRASSCKTELAILDDETYRVYVLGDDPEKAYAAAPPPVGSHTIDGIVK